MREFALIAVFEFWRVARSRRYLFLTFGLPWLLALFGCLPLLLLVLQGPRQVGIIDQADLIPMPLEEPAPSPWVHLQGFDSEAAGREALAQGRVTTLWIVPADYGETGKIRVVTEGATVRPATRYAVESLLKESLLGDVPPEVRERVAQPVDLRVRSLETGRHIRRGTEHLFALAIPIIMAVAFSSSISFSSGYLSQAVAEEKSNRLIEVLVTSTRVWPIIAGKIVGLGGLALLQLVQWAMLLVLVALGLLATGQLGQDFAFPWSIFAWGGFFFLLGYLLFAALLLGIGIVIGEPREAQQLSSVVAFTAFLPLILTPLVVAEPAGWVARLLTLVPLTTIFITPMRLALEQISMLELGLSVAILILSVWLVMRLVAAVFRMTMLRYGAKASLNAMLDGLRASYRAGRDR